MATHLCPVCGSTDLQEISGFDIADIEGQRIRYPTKSSLCRDCDSITTLTEQKTFNNWSRDNARRAFSTEVPEPPIALFDQLLKR